MISYIYLCLFIISYCFNTSSTDSGQCLSVSFSYIYTVFLNCYSILDSCFNCGRSFHLYSISISLDLYLLEQQISFNLHLNWHHNYAQKRSFKYIKNIVMFQLLLLSVLYHKLSFHLLMLVVNFKKNGRDMHCSQHYLPNRYLGFLLYVWSSKQYKE